MIREEMLKGYDNQHILFGSFFSFSNRLQAAGDSFYDEITVKQFFLLICLGLFEEDAPTLNELAQVMGSSHQNVKQIALKLEKIGFVSLIKDKVDKRKLRVVRTNKLAEFGEKYSGKDTIFMENLFSGVSDDDVVVTLKTILKLEANLEAMKED